MKKFLSFFIGFLNGLFGAGAGALLVPFLTNKFKLSQKQAHGTSIFIMLCLSVVTTTTFLSKGNIIFKEILLISIGGAVGGYISGNILYKMRNTTLSKIFAWVLVFVGGKMLFW